MSRRPDVPSSERGLTLVEMLIALLVLALGILAVAGLFPAGTRSQIGDKLSTNAAMFTQQKLEELHDVPFSDTRLTNGRHPASGHEYPGGNQAWRLWYDVSSLPAPIDDLKRVDVHVAWTHLRPETLTASTYMGH